MPKFIVKGLNEKGESVSLTLFFNNENEINDYLKSKKVIPLAIKKKRDFISVFGGKISDAEIAIVLFQLGMLIKRGVAINSSLDILIGQTDRDLLKNTLINIKKSVEQGISLSKALSESKIFPDFISEMVKIGETSGNLDEILISASRYIENRSDLRNRFSTALIYPSIVLLVGLIAVVIIAIFVTPKITSIYTNFGKQPPLELRVVAAISGILLWIIKLSPIWGIAFYFFYKKYMKDRVLNLILLKTPYIKNIYNEISLNSFSQVVSMLLKGGIPLEKAFRMGAEVVKSSRYYQHLKNVSERLTLGVKLKNALEREGVFPEEFVRLFSSGDEVGNVEEMADLTAQIYSKTASRKISILLAYLEPAIVIFLAIFVGAFIMATLLPIINLSVK